MMTHELKINDAKTELMVMGTRQQVSNVGAVSVKVGEAEITSVNKVRNFNRHNS